MVRVVHYVTEDGRDYFDEWLQCQDAEIRARVQTYWKKYKEEKRDARKRT